MGPERTRIQRRGSGVSDREIHPERPNRKRLLLPFLLLHRRSKPDQRSRSLFPVCCCSTHTPLAFRFLVLRGLGAGVADLGLSSPSPSVELRIGGRKRKGRLPAETGAQARHRTTDKGIYSRHLLLLPCLAPLSLSLSLQSFCSFLSPTPVSGLLSSSKSFPLLHPSLNLLPLPPCTTTPSLYHACFVLLALFCLLRVKEAPARRLIN